MRFNGWRWWQSLGLVLGLIGMCGGVWLGCDADIPREDDVLADAVDRVQTNLLPPLLEESTTALRNLVGALAIMPEICATPLARLGSFASTLPTAAPGTPPLGPPTTVVFDDDDGDWALTWNNVVLGAANVSPVDLRFVIRYRNESLESLLAVPFTLTPHSTVLAGVPNPLSCGAGLTECFFLYQSADGTWVLRWRTTGASARVFAGRLSSDTGLSRVVTPLSDGVAVGSLSVEDISSEIRFEELTASGEDKGFTFFSRPGDRIRFQLQIGAGSNDLASVSRDQIRLGATAQPLASGTDPGEFTLASNLPGNVTGAPTFTAVGTYIWQETTQNACNPGEDQWHIRFQKQAEVSQFSGALRARDNDAATLRVTPVGLCPAGSLIDGGRVFEYGCVPNNDALSGYDICIPAGNRITFSPEISIPPAIEELRDPRFVYIGGNSNPPPSPDPFSIRIDVELQELQSSQNLRVEDTSILIRGNNDEEDSPQLHPTQISREPLCQLTTATGQTVLHPPVRLIGNGEYSTVRFAGGAFRLDDVEFTDADVTSLRGTKDHPNCRAAPNDPSPACLPLYFPDRGELRLLTRVEEEILNSEISLFMSDIRPTLNENTATEALVDVTVNVQEVEIHFPDQPVTLGVESAE